MRQGSRDEARGKFDEVKGKVKEKVGQPVSKCEIATIEEIA